MCYYCHTLGHNRSAPPHRSINCRDPNNTYSRKNKRSSRSYQGDSKTHQKDDSNSNCSVCLDAKPDIAFIPCGHVTACESCSTKLPQCPICRENIQAKQKVYLV